MKNAPKQPPCEIKKITKEYGYPEKAGLMELCISESLHGYGNLLEITVLVQKEQLKTSQLHCEHVVIVKGTVFP